MRKLNEITRTDRYADQSFGVPAPLYYDADGKKTTDINNASVDNYGAVNVAGYSDEVFSPHEVYTPYKPLSFNPSDPTSRQLAFEARAAFESLDAIPQACQDKFEAISYANNVGSIIYPKLKKLLNSDTNE